MFMVLNGSNFFCFLFSEHSPDSAYPFQRIVDVSPNGGLFPKPFNTALKAKITSNATCGDDDAEEFCRMADIYSPRYDWKF